SLSTSERDYLEVLGNLIEGYETKAYRVDPLPPHRMLAMSIESKGVTQSEVSRATGIPVSTISELIAQKREFNRAYIEKLCGYFGLDPKAFIYLTTLSVQRDVDLWTAAHRQVGQRRGGEL